MKEISKAFLKAQKEMANPKKTSANPFFKSKYADLNSVLEAVSEPLHNNNISILQPTVSIDGKNYVKTILLHESGETLESFTEILYKNQNDAQAQGSGITYARRYGLQSLCGVGAEDDDGNIASKPNQQQNTNKETPVIWLSDAKLKEALLDVEKAKTALTFYDGKTIRKSNGNDTIYSMKKEYKEKLESFINS